MHDPEGPQARAQGMQGSSSSLLRLVMLLACLAGIAAAWRCCGRCCPPVCGSPASCQVPVPLLRLLPLCALLARADRHLLLGPPACLPQVMPNKCKYECIKKQYCWEAWKEIKAVKVRAGLGAGLGLGGRVRAGLSGGQGRPEQGWGGQRTQQIVDSEGWAQHVRLQQCSRAPSRVLAAAVCFA